MQLESVIRTSLWVTAPLNLLVAAALAFPSSWAGSLLELPAQTHPFYTLLVGALVALFGFTYLWLALQREIVRPLLLVGACGKTLAVLISIALYALGQLSGVTATVISGDLLFAALWFYWLLRTGVTRASNS